MKLSMRLVALAAVLAACLGAGTLAANIPPGYCPDAWPQETDQADNTTFVYLQVNFPVTSKMSCNARGFAGAAEAFPKLATSSMTKIIKARLGGLSACPRCMSQCTQCTNAAYMDNKTAPPFGNDIPSIPKNWVVSALNGSASCSESGSNGTASVILAVKSEANAQSMWFGLSQDVHLAQFCPTDERTYYRLVASAMSGLCRKLRNGDPVADKPSVTGCVKSAIDDSVVVGRTATCFPGDARVTIVDAATQEPTGAVRMDELAIGDTVACLVPDGVMEGAELRDDQLTFRPGVCHVYGYLDADKGRRATYVHLHYTDAAGQPAVLRATADHLIYTAGQALPATAPARALAPGGATKRADAVAVGDLLAVQAADGAGFYTAAVTDIKREAAVGAFAPLLTNAGIVVVDGAVAFPWVHLTGGAAPHPMTHLGEHFRHTRLWMDFEAARASGCKGAACPCLDAPEDPAASCVRLGDKLADVPRGWSDFEKRSFTQYLAAAEEGRTHTDYAAGIALGRAYASRPWLRRMAVALGMKPHTMGLWAANRALVRPPAA